MVSKSKSKTVVIVFCIIIVLIFAGIIAAVVVTPYDSGVLSPATLSGNSSFNGLVADTADYVFFKTDDKNNTGISRKDLKSNEEIRIYNGDVSLIYPFDGWVYFLENGSIKKTLYFGSAVETVCDKTEISFFSLNGAWIYFTDKNGILYKMRTDGKKFNKISDGSIKIEKYVVDNRMIVFTDGKSVYSMGSDGSNITTVDTGEKISQLVYTLDELYYVKDGTINRICSFAAKINHNLVFTPVKADWFNYDIDRKTGRGRLYYYTENTLYLRNTSYESDNTETETKICTKEKLNGVYIADDKVYFYNESGQLHYISNNGNSFSEFDKNGKEICTFEK